jgi:hypothetical protein
MKQWQIVALIVALAAGLGWATLGEGTWFNNALVKCNVIDMRKSALDSLARGDVATHDYRMQEINVCNGLNPDGTPKGEGSKQNPAPPAPPTPRDRAWEFFANRPASTKNAINSYGMMDSQVYPGKAMNDLSLDEAVAEFKHCMVTDPMCAAAAGAAPVFGMWTYDEANSKTKLFMDNYAEWDKATAELHKRLDQLVADGKAKIAPLNGKYTATYSVPGEIPTITTWANVSRNGQNALQLDGTQFQLLCYFQEYRKGPIANSQPMPNPAPGMTRDSEGTPRKIVEDRPVKPESPKPKPESTDTPKPEPTDTPKPEPTDTPKPEPTPTPEPKKPGEDINANPSIPPQERVDPIQSAPPDQAQPEQPDPAPTTPRVDPAPPAPDPVPRDDPAPPPPPEDDGGDNGRAPAAP